MAPEAWRGIRSAQTDIWSVAVMLYEMVAGRSPFPGDNNWDVLRHAVEFREPDPLPDALPPRLRNAILTGLQKNPQDRFRSADEMLAKLRDPSAPASRIITDTIASGLGNVHDKLRDLNEIVHALENFTQQSDNHFYIGHTLVKCASFIEDHDDRDSAESLIEELIGEMDSFERTVSIAKVRDLVRYFKRLRKEFVDQAQRLTGTANFV